MTEKIGKIQVGITSADIQAIEKPATQTHPMVIFTREGKILLGGRDFILVGEIPASDFDLDYLDPDGKARSMLTEEGLLFAHLNTDAFLDFATKLRALMEGRGTYFPVMALACDEESYLHQISPIAHLAGTVNEAIDKLLHHDLQPVQSADSSPSDCEAHGPDMSEWTRSMVEKFNNSKIILFTSPDEGSEPTAIDGIEAAGHPVFYTVGHQESWTEEQFNQAKESVRRTYKALKKMRGETDITVRTFGYALECDTPAHIYCAQKMAMIFPMEIYNEIGEYNLEEQPDKDLPAA